MLKQKRTGKIWVPDLDLPRVVIIGSGFAGMSLVRKLRNKPFHVILLDQNNYHQFQPLLYQVATSGLEPDSITFPIRKLFKGQKNFVFRMAKVEHIDPQIKTVYCDVGSIEYDYLVLATGSVTNFFGLNEIESNSIGLKSINDSLNIRSLMLQNLEKATLTDDANEREELTSIVIVGGGPAGVEMAGAMAEFKKFILPTDYPYLTGDLMKIYLVEAGPRLLSAMSERSSETTFRDLTKMDVNILLKTSVQSFDGHLALISEGKSIRAATLVWTAGVQGTFPAGLDMSKVVRGNRLKVNSYSQVEGFDDIFAIGDVGSMVSETLPMGHPMVAPAAIQQGEQLAENLYRLTKDKDLVPFEYKNKGSLATIGKKRAVADMGKLHYRGFPAWLVWSTVHLLSIIGFRNKIMVGLNWLGSYLTYDKGNRLIIRRYRKQ